MVGLFDLLPIHYLLPENAVIVADAVAHRREIESGHRIEVERRETPQAAVAEPRVRLEIAQTVPVDSVCAQRVAAKTVGLEVDDIVAEQTPNEKLEREIIASSIFRTLSP